MSRLSLLLLAIVPIVSYGQNGYNAKFEQLGTSLPTPNTYRTASGAPGHKYWQQKADYIIEAELNDETQSLTGKETITYFNNSPDDLDYLWLQLEQNVRSKNSNTPLVRKSTISEKLSGKRLLRLTGSDNYSGGFNITTVTDTNKSNLQYQINKTMMRIDLPDPLKSGESFSFNIQWSYNINDRMIHGGRSGYEYFPEDENYIYTIAQWFPRMAVYSEKDGWQNKQFLGSGEFALTFGDYDVKLTAPKDHLVAATGELTNPSEVLSAQEFERYKSAQSSYDKNIVIRTEEEAIGFEKTKSKNQKTWHFKAQNVRDFAFASSRKFIWDARAVQLNSTTPMAMSFYSKEGNPLWEKESTLAVVNALKTYSRFTIDYPYPVAISVHSASIGMEYPMICFNYGRPDENSNYTEKTRENMIDVIIHEVGHNYFPMIINSDERQWGWMDEGLDTFLENQTLFEHYPEFNVTWGTPKGLIPYMKGNKENFRPIMTNPEQMLQPGFTAYSKPGAALHILRETIMGPNLFDFAFKEYAQRWAFKHPDPADFFRTMEDASAVDLDWFWKGWFYSTDKVDLSINSVKWYRMKTKKREPERSKFSSDEKIPITVESGKLQSPDGYIEFQKTGDKEYSEFRNQVDDKSIKLSNAEKNFYEVTFENKGGLIMPIIIEWVYADGSKEMEKIPAEIWRKNEKLVSKVFIKNKEVVGINIDPNNETADVDASNNVFPRVDKFSKFDQYKQAK